METMAAVELHRFTVKEYHRMGEVGILGEDERVELTDGQVVKMSPIGVPHAGAVRRLNRFLVTAVGDRAVVSVQLPVVLGEFSEPQPHLGLLKPPESVYDSRHPEPGDVLLLIEISDTSGPYDRGVKLPLYAQSGIPEYWIVDVGRGVIEVYRSPSGDGYASVEERGPGDRVSPGALPDVEVAVSDVLGTS